LNGVSLKVFFHPHLEASVEERSIGVLALMLFSPHLTQSFFGKVLSWAEGTSIEVIMLKVPGVSLNVFFHPHHEASVEERSIRVLVLTLFSPHSSLHEVLWESAILGRRNVHRSHHVIVILGFLLLGALAVQRRMAGLATLVAFPCPSNAFR
jgi:hypothetical protein